MAITPRDGLPVLLPQPKRIRLLGDRVDLRSGTIYICGIRPSEFLPCMSKIPEGMKKRLRYSPPHPLAHANIPLLRIHSTINPNYSSSKEAYRITIRKPRNANEPTINIEASDPIGRRYALHTLAQIWHYYGFEIPCMMIEDAPSFPVRGVMLDISRDRVPKMEELLNTVEKLATWKINHIQLYTEHTFAYIGHEKVWKNSSPFTPEEIHQLDEHCRNWNINLAANQNCFGHMTRWLKHPEYKAIAETSGTWDFNGIKRSGPFSLCPTDTESRDLIEDLLIQLLPNFSSGLVNIGCDETYDVGQGRSSEAVEEKGFPQVYFDFVNRITEIVHRLEFTPMMWADVALKYPETLDLIPDGTIALAWGYEPDTPFDKWCKMLRDSGHQAWVCPGTSSWRSITGRTAERHSNLVEAANSGLAEGAEGYLVTDWGDEGHRQQWPITLHALAEGANAAWNVEAAGEFNTVASSLHAFGDDSGTVGEWLDLLGDIDIDLRGIFGNPDAKGKTTVLKNATAIYKDMHLGLKESMDNPDTASWEEVKDKLVELVYRFPENLPGQLKAELNHTIEVADFAIDRAIARRSKSGIDAKERKSLIERLRKIIDEHRTLWLLRSREGGLDDSCAYYEKILKELKADE